MIKKHSGRVYCELGVLGDNPVL